MFKLFNKKKPVVKHMNVGVEFYHNSYNSYQGTMYKKQILVVKQVANKAAAVDRILDAHKDNNVVVVRVYQVE